MTQFFAEGVGVGGGGGGLTLGPAVNTFTAATKAAAETARDAYAVANAAWLAQYDDEPTFTITINWPATPTDTVYQARRGAAWADVTGLVRGATGADGSDGAVGATGATGAAGSPGAPGAPGAAGSQGADGTQGTQGLYDVTVYQNAAAAPATPTGGSINVTTGAVTPPTGFTNNPTSPSTGENTYATRTTINPATQTGSITPTWSAVFEAGGAGPAGPQGERGPAGADGADGADGAAGPAGADGATGAMGAQGEQGEQGEQGPQGEAGTGGGTTAAAVETLFDNRADTETALAVLAGGVNWARTLNLPFARAIVEDDDDHDLRVRFQMTQDGQIRKFDYVINAGEFRLTDEYTAVTGTAAPTTGYFPFIGVDGRASRSATSLFGRANIGVRTRTTDGEDSLRLLMSSSGNSHVAISEVRGIVELIPRGGLAGPMGPAGTDGANGTDGTNGANGSQGPQGDQGVQGERGVQGVAGAAGAGSTFIVQDESDAAVGGVTQLRVVGATASIVVAAGIATLTIGSGAAPTHTTDQYLALKATDDFTPGDFTGAQGVAFPDGSHTATAPDVTGNVYFAIARLAADPDLVFVDVDNSGLNQLGGLTKQTATITILSNEYEVWVSNHNAEYNGAVVEAR